MTANHPPRLNRFESYLAHRKEHNNGRICSIDCCGYLYFRFHCHIFCNRLLLWVQKRKQVKVIIAGSRSIASYDVVRKAIRESYFDIDEVVSGNAKGVDRWGELYANQNNLDLVIFPANWGRYGKSAGVMRNRKMAKYADALIAVWDGESRGTKHMIDIAKEYNLEVFVYNASVT